MLAPAATRSKNLPTSRAVCLIPRPRQPFSFVVFLCTLLAVFFLQPVKLFAQDSKTEDDVVRVTTDLLLFPIRIKNKQGQAVQGLTENDLSLDDKDRVTTSLYFAPGADRVALVFALDQSGSLREVIAQQREAALALFGRFSQRSRIAILRFAQSASLVVPLMPDTEAARAAFSFSAASNQR